MKFDAYAGNVSGSVTASQLAELAAIGVQGHAKRGRPRGRYHDCFDVQLGSDLAGWVAHDQQLGAVYFEFKGQTTPEFVSTVRRHFGDTHTVSRLDSCEDFDDVSAFERLAAIVDRAKDPRVQSKAITPRGADTGQTFYWGSSSSQVQVRLYEAGKMKDRLHFMRPDWVRVEAQVRPGKGVQKAKAAYVSPVDVWGFGGWSARAAESICNVEVNRFQAPSDPSQFDKTTLYVARTFRRHWEIMLEDFGSGECVFRELQAVWRADDEAKARFADLVKGK
jgi:hypothetical protein